MEGSEARPAKATYERLTAEEMDEQRRQNVAYQYLCRLEEAKRWMEACLKEELPSPVEMEESLRNGVLLAKLGHFFAPDVVPFRKIYDLEQMRYKANGLHFRHTDNINFWLTAVSHIGLPKTFLPETTDIYDKKNMPRVIYCIHALSLFLFRLGLAPQIHDLYGKVKFTEEELNNMTSELAKYGLQLPAFSKIGGILASELSVDEASVHAAVLAINEAVERGVVEDTLAALKNPNAMLGNLREPLAAVYQELLAQVKMEKVANSRNWYLQDNGDNHDIYDRYLTQAEIQGNINQVNVHGALETIDESLEKQNSEALLEALSDPALGLRGVRRDFGDWYLEQLSLDREQKALELGLAELLEKEEIQAGVAAANAKGDQELAMLQAVGRINRAIRRGLAADTVKELMCPEAQLPEVYPFAASMYQQELTLIQRQQQGELAQEELFVALEMLSAVALINRYLEAGDAGGFWSSLSSPALGLADVDRENAQRYFDALGRLRQEQSVAGAFLSWNDLQATVSQVNGQVQEESEQILAVSLINEALNQANPEKTLTALLLPSAGLDCVTLPVGPRYHHILTAAKKRKAQVTRDPGAALWLEEIRQGVAKANQETEAALKMALGVAAINQAIKEGKSAQTERVLHNPAVALYGVLTECASGYQRVLQASMARKKQAGSKLFWVQHRMKDGAAFYFHLQTFQGTWERPSDCTLNTSHLSREEIQAAITSVTAAHDRHRLWISNVGFVIQLQARMRGFLVRQEFAKHSHFLRTQLPAIIKIQAHWRGYRQRKTYLERMRFLRANVASVTKIQAWVRMCIARKRYRERRRFFRKNIRSIVKIQAFFRARRARDDYRMLVRDRHPPLAVVRRFAHLLDQRQQDFWEEAELLRLQEDVVRKIRSNQQLEQDLNLMDIKIGLLVKNRITLQEVVLHSKKLTKKNKEHLSDMMALDRQKGLKSLSKEKRQKLEAYQHLFYLLQTQPIYLAKLIFQMPQNKTTKFMESVIFTLYNYASNRREAYLLLQLFKTALQEEIKSKVEQPQDMVTGSPTVIKLVVSFYRNGRGQSALREILGGVIQGVLEDRTLSVYTDPIHLYKTWINQTEAQTGQRSHLPYDVTPEQALSHPEVQRRMDISVRSLLTVTEKFLTAILSSVDQIPYGMRYVAKVLKTSLAEKFPRATEGEICKVVGNLLYYRFLNPAVVAPDAFDIVALAAGGALSSSQRHILGAVAQLLQHAAAGKPFSGENGHLRVLNAYVEETHLKFRKFICKACRVPEPEERFAMDEYSDMVALAKPVVYITVGELVNTHKLLLEHQDSIAPDHRDPLHELLEDLGELPTVPALIGQNLASDGNLDMSQLEVSLTLTSKFEGLEADPEDTNTRSLLLRTKQMLVDIIQFQAGDSLQDILSFLPSGEQEAAHHILMSRRQAFEAQTPEPLKRRRSLTAQSLLSIREKQRRVLKNLRHLESLGLVTSADGYQGLVDEMAQDIRNQRRHRQRRKAELVKLRATFQGLQAKTAFYEEQGDYYNQYIRTCLDSLAHSNKSDRKGKKQPSLHYTAAQLWEKGVLVEIEDLPVTHFRNVIFDIIPGEEAGKFEVKAKFMGVDMERFQVHYQDLLQLQYEGVAVMKLFNKAKVNVNLLIFLLNKKLYLK
ncbi:ras GTPase-activating-like protein IQGAP3 [Monodelphis domestica]|uniref:ras GTPase-activating-like protein IQGAP3 n=1 Tax=Monodelphis domestica TaxID=13616 RepID=UPI0024E22F46|nr:ras GTPase-activating-like protein IQGAP3 [Monodelphis domestica]XP_056672220.1 ras GTPase-activating-like protein IQGAP3 [Monodelphis domestica]